MSIGQQQRVGILPASGPVTVSVWETPQAFLNQAADFLEANEVENNLVLGLCLDLLRRPADEPWFWATLEEDGQVAGAALRAPGHPVVITDLPAGAADGLVAAVAARHPDAAGVTGPVVAAAQFAQAWSRRTGQSVALSIDHRLYDCREVRAPAAVSGRLRVAVENDQPWLVDWVDAFLTAVQHPEQRDTVRAVTAGKIAAGRLWVWDDGGPMTCVGFSRETQRGVSINHVYTPPEFRRRGYASAAVAALTQQQLDSGKEFCCLYADLANATANHIYQAIGYEPACDAALWRWGR